MKIKKFLALALSSVLLVGSLVGCSSAGNDTSSTTADGEEKVLNIYTWATYFPDDVITAFEEETGIQVNYTNFDTNENMLLKLEATKGGEYDIVLASDYIIDIAIKNNLVGELPKDEIPNFGNINPAYQNQYYDPDNKYTVPYSAGIPLIIYDPMKVSVNIDGYSSLWNPALADSIVMMDDPRNVIGMTLRSLGYSLNSTDSAELEEANAKLSELKPNIRALNYDNPQSLLISGEATVGYVFTSQIVATLADRPDMEVVYPKEGLGFGIDSIFVPVAAPHPSNAATFINFILEAERGAAISEAIGYICCNQAAESYLSEDYKDNPAYNIPQEALENSEMVQDIGAEATEEYNNIWLAFKQ